MPKPPTLVKNVILTCHPTPSRTPNAYTKATGQIWDLAPYKGTAQYDEWTLACNYGKGPKLVNKGAVGYHRQQSQFAGFFVFDIVNGGSIADYKMSYGMQVIFDKWIPCSLIKAGPFGEHGGQAQTGSELSPLIVQRLRSVMTPRYRQFLDALVAYYS